MNENVLDAVHFVEIESLLLKFAPSVRNLQLLPHSVQLSREELAVAEEVSLSDPSLRLRRFDELQNCRRRNPSKEKNDRRNREERERKKRERKKRNTPLQEREKFEYDKTNKTETQRVCVEKQYNQSRHSDDKCQRY